MSIARQYRAPIDRHAQLAHARAAKAERVERVEQDIAQHLIPLWRQVAGRFREGSSVDRWERFAEWCDGDGASDVARAQQEAADAALDRLLLERDDADTWEPGDDADTWEPGDDADLDASFDPCSFDAGAVTPRNDTAPQPDVRPEVVGLTLAYRVWRGGRPCEAYLSEADARAHA